MKLRIWLLLLVSAQAPGATAECVKQFPGLKKTIEAMGPLQEPKLGFGKLVAKMKEATAAAETQREEIQKLGCGEAPHEGLDPCLKPLIWSCEGVPFIVDKGFLASVKKTKTEETALLTNQLSEGSNLFGTCCGDFGCHPTGAGVPVLFYDKVKISALAFLADEPGVYGDIALKTLELSAAGIKGATCSCELPQTEDRKEVEQNLDSVAAALPLKSERGKKVSFALTAIAAGFKKIPKRTCKLPGY